MLVMSSWHNEGRGLAGMHACGHVGMRTCRYARMLPSILVGMCACVHAPVRASVSEHVFERFA